MINNEAQEKIIRNMENKAVVILTMDKSWLFEKEKLDEFLDAWYELEDYYKIYLDGVLDARAVYIFGVY